MNYIVGALAAVLLLLLLDRLRQIRWPLSWVVCLFRRSACPRSSRGDARPLYIAMYVLKAAGTVGVLAAAWQNAVPWYVGLLVAGILCWAINTRRQWRNGPPPQVLSGSTPLDGPIQRRFDAPPPGGMERRAED